MTDTAKLDAALDDCNDRLGQAMIVLGDMQTRVRELTLERGTLARAKALVTPQAEPPAPEPQPPRDLLAECIAAMRPHAAIFYTLSDRGATDHLKSLGFKFSIRTVRNALREIAKESRAAAPTEQGDLNPRSDAQASPSSTPDGDGAGADDEMPGFLRRTKDQAKTAE